MAMIINSPGIFPSFHRRIRENHARSGCPAMPPGKKAGHILVFPATPNPTGVAYSNTPVAKNKIFFEYFIQQRYSRTSYPQGISFVGADKLLNSAL
ncbi:MAG: hypothetical protein RQ753_04535 [Desulfurivibrionaceae bacterium]|nr:hypothetical protein [Desulfurivibrionaceae bacterium]